MQLAHKLLHDTDENLLNFTREELSFSVAHSDVLQLCIVLQEECQVLIRHVNVEITAVCTMLFNCLATASLRILVDLALDVLLSISDQDRAVWITRAHLALFTLEGREESRVDRGRLLVLELLGDVTRHSEVRVLVTFKRR